MGWFLLLPVLGLLTAPWSLLPVLSAGRAAGLAAQILATLAVVAWLGRLPWRRRCWLSASGGIAATLVGAGMVLDVALGAPLAVALHGDTPYIIGGGSASRGAVLHALLLFPAAAGLWRLGYRVFAVALIVVGVGVVGMNTSDTAMMGACLGIALGGVLALLPVLARILAPLAVATVLLMPAAVPILQHVAYCHTIMAAPSIAHRLAIWGTVHDLILDKPLLGWGVDAARSAPGGKEALYLRACDDNGAATGRIEVIGEAIPLHPHNGALDLWFSLGAVGVLAACWALWRSFSAATKRWPGRLGAATLGATNAIIFVTILLGYGLWQGWFTASICLSLSALSLLPGDDDEATQHTRISNG
jgi:O-antigen ligase